MLYAIGDPHLHFGVSLTLPMETSSPLWRGHEERFRQGWLHTVTQEDTVVVCGDISFGRNDKQCQRDVDFLAALPGRKILLRGNHDNYWDAKKTEKLNERWKGTFSFLQNNHFSYGSVALVGTKGYAWEGKDTPEHARTLVEREAERLETSFQSAAREGFSRFVVFLHFPPTDYTQRTSVFCRMAEKWGAEQVIYAHCHGRHRFDDSIRGVYKGIRYTLVSGDCLNWRPFRVL